MALDLFDMIQGIHESLFRHSPHMALYLLVSFQECWVRLRSQEIRSQKGQLPFVYLILSLEYPMFD